MRLYRGLKEPYDPEKVGGRQEGAMPDMFGTDFTACPHAALQYAQGRRGLVLVVEVPNDSTRVTEELWHIGDGPKRLMVWGYFDKFIVAEIPAKELRKHVRRKGVVAASDDYKANVLVQAVKEWIGNVDV